MIKDVVGFNEVLIFNSNKPDGTIRKLTTVTKLNSFGWKHSVKLDYGVFKMYDWYKKRS